MRLIRIQKGDTIVEVLISISVLSLILSASYALANRSSYAVRQAQERSEAVKIAESQLESLKSFLSDEGNEPPATGSWCMRDSQTTQSGFLSDVPVSASADVLDEYPVECQKGTDNRYKNSIRRGTTPATANTYTAVTRWQRVTGTGNDEVTFVYRLYPAESTTLDLTAAPTVTDVCPGPSWPGTQTSIPSGHMIDSSGNCVPIPPPPSYCSNPPYVIPGSTAPPAGMVRNASGDCVWIPYVWYGTSDPFFAGFTYPGAVRNLACAPRSFPLRTCEEGYIFWFLPAVISWSSPVTITYDLTKNIFNPVDPSTLIATPLGQPIPAGPATLNMTWSNDPNGSLSPQAGYRPRVRIRIDGGSNPCAPTDYCLLSVYSSSNYMRDSISLNIPEGATSMTIEWINDSFSPGLYDVNLAIPEITITRN